MRHMWTRVYYTVICWMIWWGALPVWGKNPADIEPEAPPERSWVPAYLFVVLSIALGIILVSRSSGRHAELRPDQSS